MVVRSGLSWPSPVAAGGSPGVERNRYLDLLRVAAIGGVVYGHWLLISVTYSSGQLSSADALDYVAWAERPTRRLPAGIGPSGPWSPVLLLAGLAASMFGLARLAIAGFAPGGHLPALALAACAAGLAATLLTGRAPAAGARPQAKGGRPSGGRCRRSPRAPAGSGRRDGARSTSARCA